MPDKEKW